MISTVKSFWRFLAMLVEYAGMARGHSRIRGIWDRIGLFNTLLSLTLKAKYTPKSEVEQRILGFKVSANSAQTLLSLFREIVIDEVYHFTSEEEKPEIIDCGANMGISVLYFKHLYPQAHIIAIEPHPSAFAYLERNVAQNALTNIQAVQACLSDHIGKEAFYLPPTGNIFNGAIYSDTGKTYLGEIDSVRLSDYLGQKQVDLVKIDVEGAEREILRDLKHSGRLNLSKYYIIEYHQLSGYTDIAQELIETFYQHGFKCRMQGECQSGLESQMMYFSR